MPFIVSLRRLVLVSLLLSLSAATAFARPEHPRTVVIVSWDGAADWVMDRLLAEGKLPNVTRLMKQGVRAAYSTPAYPSKTACGHAALWTGAYGDVNGITGTRFLSYHALNIPCWSRGRASWQPRYRRNRSM